MTTYYPATRTPYDAESSRGQATIENPGYRVIIVMHGQFPNHRSQRDYIFNGMRIRLSNLFAEVANRSSAINSITLTFVASNAELRGLSSHPKEIVVHVYQQYSAGLIGPYLESLATHGPPAKRTEFANTHRTFRNGTGHTLGLTVNGWYDDANSQRVAWEYSEIYIDPTYESFPDRHAGASNEDEYMRDQVGGGMAGIIYHEILHNKVDPRHPDSWDLHRNPGLAQIHGYAPPRTQDLQNQTRAEHDRSNAGIRLLAPHLHRPSPVQYIPGRDTFMTSALNLGGMDSRNAPPSESEDDSGSQSGGQGDGLDMSGIDEPFP